MPFVFLFFYINEGSFDYFELDWVRLNPGGRGGLAVWINCIPVFKSGRAFSRQGEMIGNAWGYVGLTWSGRKKRFCFGGGQEGERGFVLGHDMVWPMGYQSRPFSRFVDIHFLPFAFVFLSTLLFLVELEVM